MNERSIDIGELPDDVEARLALAAALLRRPERCQDSERALRLRHPHLPDEVLQSAVHHLYRDLPDALIDLAGVIELSLRMPTRDVGYGASLHVLDHLYNWFQMQALLPCGVDALRSLVAEAETALRQGETAAAMEALEDLRKRLDADLQPPQFEHPC